jgi:hypothetical protein
MTEEIKKNVIALTVKDRLLVTQLYPKESNLVEQTIVRDISRKIEISQKEQEEIGLKAVQQGFTWDQEKELVKQIELSDIELSLLRDRVNALDSEKKITQQILELCLKIKNV